ncbi:MAG TPA: DUF2934 domain-containing protein [bacterium]|jgi:hypothetical protein|nr:DUF2934 domain-containing protein [bacterium]
MPKNKISETESLPIEEEKIKLVAEDVDETQQQIEEAAYYIGLNRGRNSHPGDELNDWFEAERAVKENLQ